MQVIFIQNELKKFENLLKVIKVGSCMFEFQVVSVFFASTKFKYLTGPVQYLNYRWLLKESPRAYGFRLFNEEMVRVTWDQN